jgi:hypothetical protein
MNAREVVRLAASRVESSEEVRSWLCNDEQGSWERAAQEMIEATVERRALLQLSDEQAADEMANRLALRALRAVLAREKGGS